jgi:hypothetical protein
MIKVQGTIPAPLNYAPPGYRPFPKAICTSVNHQVCHGVPGERVLKAGDMERVLPRMTKHLEEPRVGQLVRRLSEA